ncbi:major facilitator superfamily protein [Lasiosphaeria hispida]|uniref:Major facilitator superfamily protein n=1 Tax=Lasiosphaeria hispida TaxID=260671 RepID=A0AAJ0MFP8_9PEZI|nr:major facilitator superfamily protein [Lasiosphaeria hispida]
MATGTSYTANNGPGKDSLGVSLSTSPTEEHATNSESTDEEKKLNANQTIEQAVPEDAEPPSDPEKVSYGWRFWIIYASLVAATLLSALDGSIVATALPTIARNLETGPDFIWVVNIYFLTGAVFQPLFAQLSDLWGRRWVFIAVVVIFVLGSGLCGGAHNGNMLIAARAVQGVGAGGLNIMVDIIICDLVPMRDRSKFLGMIFAIIGIFTALGPLIGGALAQAGFWPWVFYINLPIGGVCLLVMFFFLHTGTPEKTSFTVKMTRLDYIGITLLTISCILIMYATTYAGTRYAWSSAPVLGPLISGLLLLLLFALYETVPASPVVPPRLFANRTSAAAFAITFLHSILCLWTVYIFALYFQAVQLASATRAGVYLLPTVLTFPIAAALGGGLMAKTGRYKPLHLASFALLTLGCGLASLLGPTSSPAAWVFFQIFVSVGIGLPMACLLPAVQAELGEADVALSTGTWAFIRSVGTIWAVTIPAAVFGNRFEGLLGGVGDEAARAVLSGGEAYAHGTAEFVGGFKGVVGEQVLAVYSASIQRVWQVGEKGTKEPAP